ncbi:LysR family transcriptional regulator [Novosphingobium flavum]|uniref:LysR family transcriptional regulator n=1 Tax=Novosphingobium flavum TaxID=1778672 RepID=A0A7X1KNA0_9SPHN|nr:LysR family transcriptional regulator [Novosphingobium flavum]MBC2667481.1 LysR family transcriptional regulator [Novosphingobium flavum]
MDMGASLERHVANLLTVLAVGESGSMTAASRTNLKATSAISRSVQELELEVGKPLFERTARGVRETEYGKIILERAARLRDELDSAADAVFRAVPRGKQPSRHRTRAVLASGRKLKMIADICELRSIGAAAQRIGMSQAGVSMAIGRVEAALGIDLFIRRNEGVAPTEAAEILAGCASRVVAELRHLQADLLSITGSVGGTIVVGTTHLGRSYSFPVAIAAAIERHPYIRVRQVEGSYRHLVGQLRAGEIDVLFGVLREGDLGGGLVGEPLFVDRMSVLAGAGHPLASRGKLDLADLTREKWILPSPNSVGLDQVEACFRGLGLPVPRSSVETGDLATLRQLLETDNMVAIASPRQLAFEIRAGVVVELPVEFEVPGIEVGLIHRASALMPQAALALIEEVRRLAA